MFQRFSDGQNFSGVLLDHHLHGGQRGGQRPDLGLKSNIAILSNPFNHSLKCTVKPVYNGHPWDPQKVAAVQSWPDYRFFNQNWN
jgi:hypothetical protein